MTRRPDIPVFAFYERLVMRCLFAWLVWDATPRALVVHGIPAPNGITRLVDLHFLLDPNVYSAMRVALALALLFYATRILVWLALPVALFVHVAANAVINSQGAVQHSAQIVSLVLLAQTAAHYYGFWQRREGEEEALRESRAIWWSQQTIVAVYLLAGIAKLIVTKGAWIWQVRWIGVSIAKAAYQTFYNTFDHAELNQQLRVANFAAGHGWLVVGIATAGLALELGSPLALCNRRWAAVVGLALLFFHLGLDYSMRLTFPYNRWLLIIFLINAPYWLATGGGKIFRRPGEPVTSP